jgi:hypothetical protein
MTVMPPIIWPRPSGKWGTEEGYAFLWEAYQRQYKPQLIAVARPHHLIWAGEKVTLDGSKSWSRDGQIGAKAAHHTACGNSFTDHRPRQQRNTQCERCHTPVEHRYGNRRATRIGDAHAQFLDPRLDCFVGRDVDSAAVARY